MHLLFAFQGNASLNLLVAEVRCGAEPEFYSGGDALKGDALLGCRVTSACILHSHRPQNQDTVGGGQVSGLLAGHRR